MNHRDYCPKIMHYNVFFMKLSNILKSNNINLIYKERDIYCHELIRFGKNWSQMIAMIQYGLTNHSLEINLIAA